MKTKPLEVGDRVSVKYVTDIHGNEATIYLDGVLTKQEKRGGWIVEYQLSCVCGAEKYRDWWHEDDITSKHIIGPTDQERFEKAEMVKASDWTGPVCYDDKHYYSIEDLEESVDYPYPEFVWAVRYETVWECDYSKVIVLGE